MFIAPMLLQKMETAVNDPATIAEPKMDGFRLILSTMEAQAKAFTRHGNEVLDRFPELQRLSLPPGTVLDGELIVIGSGGNPDFEAVMRRLKTRDPRKVQALARRMPVQYVVFDILYHQGNPLAGLPLLERKERLETAVVETETIARIRYTDGNGADLFEACQAADLEGIVLKKKESRYFPGRRSEVWRKVINYQHTDAVITGYRKSEFGLLLGLMDTAGQLRPAGLVELGMGPKERKAFHQVAPLLVTREDRKFVHLDPRLICRVKFRGWTKDGFMRLPVFEKFCL